MNQTGNFVKPLHRKCVVCVTLSHTPVFEPPGACTVPSVHFLSSSELEEVVFEENWYFLFTVMGMLQLSRYLRNGTVDYCKSTMETWHKRRYTHSHKLLPDNTVKAANLLVGAGSLVFKGEFIHASRITVSRCRILQTHHWTLLRHCRCRKWIMSSCQKDTQYACNKFSATSVYKRKQMSFLTILHFLWVLSKYGVRICHNFKAPVFKWNFVFFLTTSMEDSETFKWSVLLLNQAHHQSFSFRVWMGMEPVMAEGSAGTAGSRGSWACELPYKSPGMSLWAWPCSSPQLCSRLSHSHCCRWMSHCSPVVRGSHCCHGYHNHWIPCCEPAKDTVAI